MSLQQLEFICSTHSIDDCIRIYLMTGASICLVLLLVGSILPSHAGGFSPFWKGATRFWQVLASSSSPEEGESSLIGKEQLQWWEDLAPPFSLRKPDGLEEEEEQDEEEYDSRLMALGNPVQHDGIKLPRITHFCFLVHGHRGYSRDLGYIQAKMECVAARRKLRKRKELLRKAATEKDSDNGTEGETKEKKNSFMPDLVVHSTCCNEKKTDDGVVNGGERLAEEILEVIQTEMKNRPNEQNVTISFLGNSLGGIYSRYAVAELFGQCKKLSDGHYLLDDRYHLHFNVFCTTATPHLGIAGYTFLPLPRSAEIGVAHAMGDTGKDLFRLNDLMKRMATAPEFLQPLRAFRKRIAYANAYGTDFPVPLQTAAFLSESSTYPHHFVEDSHDEDRLVVDDNGLVIATLHTEPEHEHDGEYKESEDFVVDKEENDELVEMSRSLDSLGWKKIFIDVRKEIPQISLPKVLSRIGGSSTPTPESTTPTTDSAPESDSEVESLHKLKEKGVVSSKDIAAALTTPLFFDEKLYWPMGHNMMVAFSRSRLSTYLHKAGRPVVDSLANELVTSIFSWSPPEEDAKAGQEQKEPDVVAGQAL